jgi:hypothetical protein
VSSLANPDSPLLFFAGCQWLYRWQVWHLPIGRGPRRSPGARRAASRACAVRLFASPDFQTKRVNHRGIGGRYLYRDLGEAHLDGGIEPAKQGRHPIEPSRAGAVCCLRSPDFQRRRRFRFQTGPIGRALEHNAAYTFL